MKLYLSSQHIGCAPHVLLGMIGGNKTVGVIANAIDAYDDYHRASRVQKEIDRLSELGLEAEELDLRAYFGRTEALRGKLEQLDMVWVRGGNVYTLVRAMEQSGFSKVAPVLIHNDHLVFAGYSAAAIIAAPDLLGSELMDDPHELPLGYQDHKPPFSALGFLDHYIACHYGSSQPWATNVAQYIDHVTNKRKNVLKLEDGDVYIVNDGSKNGYIARGKEDKPCTVVASSLSV